jgi:hypothetical protein
VKKHEGKFYYFGSWDGPEAAEARFQMWEEAGRPGQVPELNSVVPGNEAAKRPPNRWRGFPLWPHPNGQWCKKINGKPYYFGTKDHPDGPYEEYLEVSRALNNGQDPTITYTTPSL